MDLLNALAAARFEEAEAELYAGAEDRSDPVSGDRDQLGDRSGEATTLNNIERLYDMLETSPRR